MRLEIIVRILRLSLVCLLSLTAVLMLCQRRFFGVVVNGQGLSLSSPTEVVASDNAYFNKVQVTWATVKDVT